MLLVLSLMNSPMYFAVILNTSNAHAGLILSLSSGFGQCVGSLWAGQYVQHSFLNRFLGALRLVGPQGSRGPR